jgi:hypothetical protein
VVYLKKEKGDKTMKKRILPIALIVAAVAVLWAYKGEESESVQ